MERQFKVKPELMFVYLPECGRVKGERILEGDKYAKYLNTHLIEVTPTAPFVVPSVEEDAVELLLAEDFTDSGTEPEIHVSEPEYTILPVFNGAELLSVDEHLALAAKGSEPGLVLQSSKKGRPKTK